MKDHLYIIPIEKIVDYFYPKYQNYLDDIEFLLPKLINMLSTNKYTASESYNWLIGNDLSLIWSLLNQRNPNQISFDQFKEMYLKLIPFLNHYIINKNFIESEVAIVNNCFYIKTFSDDNVIKALELIDDDGVSDDFSNFSQIKQTYFQ